MMPSKSGRFVKLSEKRNVTVTFVCLAVLLGSGCSSIPGYYFAPKTIRIDGNTYTACSGFVRLYSPSRDVTASSRTTYEITFTDEFGQFQDFKDVASYSVEENPNATFAMPYPLPSPSVVNYSDGKPFQPRATVLFGKNGDGGRAIYVSPGNWKPVPCSWDAQPV